MRTRSSIKYVLYAVMSITFFTNCSKDEITTEEKSLQTFQEVEFEHSNKLTKNSVSCLEPGNSFLLKSISGGIYDKDNIARKIIYAKAYQEINGVKIFVNYNIDKNIENLPAKIEITFNGQKISFDGVNPGEYVSYKFPLPDKSSTDDALEFKVDQYVYLQPVTLDDPISLISVCDVEVGDLAYGGTVGYIFKEGDPDYIPGENHGYVIYDPQISAKWADAQSNAESYVKDEYTDWAVPSKEQLELMEIFILPDYLEWTSNEVDDQLALAYAGTFSGLSYSPHSKDISIPFLLIREF